MADAVYFLLTLATACQHQVSSTFLFFISRFKLKEQSLVGTWHFFFFFFFLAEGKELSNLGMKFLALYSLYIVKACQVRHMSAPILLAKTSHRAKPDITRKIHSTPGEALKVVRPRVGPSKVLLQKEDQLWEMIIQFLEAVSLNIFSYVISIPLARLSIPEQITHRLFFVVVVF